ncbi:MAG: T9SS type A sorting domain-containing protein [Flavobacteriales bacterium]|nr:T9SS type A sorting domain-containing protein [Flavobacteriales bacterium]
MRKSLSLAALLLCAIPSLWAQVSHGGQPLAWSQTSTSAQIEFIRLPELDMTTISEEDRENDRYKEFGFRFGIERNVELNASTSGTWTTEGNLNVWRLGIHAPNAKGVSVLFSQFNIPKKASLFVYDEERTHFIGSFNYTNLQANGMLSTSLVYGENVIIELQLPADANTSDVALSISKIVHAYRGLDSQFEELKALARGPFGNSGACNININCPLGDDWQVEKKTVALIADGGFATCSGALINNTANDGYPYFLTANHCLGGGVGNWVFYFNHEAANCSGNTGPTNQSVSGATILANNSGSDFGLLEINNGNAIPANFNVEFAGWDNSDQESAVTAATGIHHPSGDLKKICHDEDGPTHNFQDGAEVWYIDQWEDGVTEGGSSGSPLFNQDHRIIGQLYGGAAACSGSSNNGQADWYGRFGVSWNTGTTSSTRLIDWLDPLSTGATTLDGYPTGAVSYTLDASSYGLLNVPEVLCEPAFISPTFVLKNNGTSNLTSCTITYSYNGGGAQTTNWTGDLIQGATENVQLGSFTALIGTNTIDVEISSANGQTDENPNNNSSTQTFDLNVGEQVLELTIETDNYGYETYWEVRGPSNQLVASGGNTDVGANGGGNQTAAQGDPGAYAANATITETIQLVGDGCYTFLIVDDFGDGICCGFFSGNGSYSLKDGNGVVMAEGGEFGDSEETEFGMVAGLSVSETDLGRLDLYPNPTNGTVYIDVEHAEMLTGITVTDLLGRNVLQVNGQKSNRTTLDLSPFKNGVYHVSLYSENGVVTKKVIVLND